MKYNWKKHSALFVLTGYLILFFMSVFHTHELSVTFPGIHQQQSRDHHTTHHFNQNGECIIHLAFSSLHNSHPSGTTPFKIEIGTPEVFASSLTTHVLSNPKASKDSRGPPSDNSSI